MPEQKKKFKAADFVSKIVKDPNSPPNALLLQGYLGDSSEEGHIRLYLDPQLADYVEIPEDAVLHTQEIPGSPLGETYVWIDRDAELTHGKAGPQRTKAKFLEGRVQQQFLGGAADATGAAAAGTFPPFSVLQPGCVPYTIGIACIPSVVPNFCPTRYPIACQSRYIIQCHTRSPLQCPPPPSVLTMCISVQVACPSQTPQLCPVASANMCPEIGPEQFAARAAAPQPSVMIQQCPSAVDACPSRLCPSVQVIPCQSQFIECPSVQVFECPSVPVNQCPSVPAVKCQSRLYECPSVPVNLCPSVPINPCQSVPVVQCQSQFIECPSAVDACPSRLPPCPTVPVNQCASVPAIRCPSVVIQQCPSAVDACPSRLTPCQSVMDAQCIPSVVQCPPSIPVFSCPSRGIAVCFTVACEAFPGR